MGGNMDYDLVIIGSGPAGHTAALEAAKRKYKTALIEKDPDMTGGVCLNEGCIPLKGLLHFSAYSKNYDEILERVMSKVSGLRQGLLGRLKNAGVEIIKGAAKFASRNEVDVAGKKIKGKYFLIAAGSSPKRLFEKGAFSTDKIFSLDRVPGSALIIGGGVIGCEYASLLSNLGTSVTIIEFLNGILCGEDEEAVRLLAREFKKKKISIMTGSNVLEINGHDVRIRSGENEITGKYDMIFEATGRVPRTAGLGLDAAGVETDAKGFIVTNEYMQTSNHAIYAAGDCVNTPMLAYTASKEAETAIAHLSTEECKAIDYQNMPKLIFSRPQLGSVGLSEARAVERAVNIKIYKYFFKAVGKAVIEGKDAGFIKIVADADKQEIVGAVMVGEEIEGAINELSIIINNKIKIEDVKKCMHIHPSYSEIITEALNYG
jgi:dihydrolipoamide dehydrogenase